MPKEKLILSQDGSHTIESAQFGVTYHSKYGAIQETQTVFIDAGLHYQLEQNKSQIKILEMGFGTGLNVLMTFLDAKESDSRIDFHTIEAYPISLEAVHDLNYPELLGLEKAEIEQFYKMHSSIESIELSDKFSFTKHLTFLESFETKEKFDVIYFDAFAPSSQDHLWTEDVMSKLAGLCNNGAVLTSYCAKGSFKRALKSTGFLVEGLPGPIGKREMTRAIFK